MGMLVRSIPVLSLLFCLPVTAQTGLESSVFGSGNLVGAGTESVVESTVGQNIIGSSSNSLTIHHAGYWAVQNRTGPVSVEHKSEIPFNPVLHQNYPNPFNPSTTIRFSILERQHVRLTVYDLLGREVTKLVDDEREAGWYSVIFDASGLASGVYLFRIQTGSFVSVKRCILLK
jgi:hypothetical protein